MMKNADRRGTSLSCSRRSSALRKTVVLPALLSCLVAAGCDSGSSIGNPLSIDDDSSNGPAVDPVGQTPTSPPTGGGNVSGPVFNSLESDIVDNAQVYSAEGYAALDVIRVDLVTRTVAGACVERDQSGCTLADVLADTNSRDSFKVDIPVHFSATDFANDGLVNNAELRQRGGGARVAPQKSFRIKLDDKDQLWRGERHLQLNKHPFDNSRVRNKLSFDLMSAIPNLPAFRTQFVNLWIDNGQGPEDYGLFTHVERGDERYLDRHGLDTDGRLYKAEFFQFRLNDRDTLLIDAEGEPLDSAVFETVLEIESGKDHRNLIAMLDALHDPDISFQSVLDRYFNENNVLTWLAVNLLLGQQDAVRHNYFLYNPEGSEKFYFLPWDYDLTFEDHEEPPNGLSAEALKARLQFGYAVGSTNDFINSYYRLPGTHDKILAAANELRSQYLSDTTIAESAALLSATAGPFISTEPDIAHNANFSVDSSADFAIKVAFNHTAMANNFSIPLPPTMMVPERIGQNYRFNWVRAHELTGNELTYELQLATSAAFTADSIEYSATGIPDTLFDDTSDSRAIITHEVAAAQLSSGLHFARLVTRSVLEPTRYWQVADNVLELDGNNFRGVVQFVVE